LWENRQAYIDNSPLFFADRIKTPLLILHNDNDGAVPWYQGIELFMALRRLGRPAWLLNYNGEPHGITKEENRRDFAIRMQQFFDHYLQDAPPAQWMVQGIPATEKGKEFGLELVPAPVVDHDN
jgi:dipeptidyl aminopeptidase/acylaminoacyl peptidase